MMAGSTLRSSTTASRCWTRNSSTRTVCVSASQPHACRASLSAGGRPGPIVEASHPDKIEPRPEILLRSARVRKLLGVEVSDEEIVDIVKDKLDELMGKEIEIPLRGALSTENIRVNVPSVFTVAIGTELLEFFLDRFEAGSFLHFEMVPDLLPPRQLELLSEFPAGSVQLEAGVQTMDPEVAERIGLSARGYHRVLRVARTIAIRVGLPRQAGLDILAGLAIHAGLVQRTVRVLVALGVTHKA